MPGVQTAPVGYLLGPKRRNVYTPNRARFDGSNDYLTLAGKLQDGGVAIVNADNVVFSCLVTFDAASDGQFAEIYNANSNTVDIEKQSDDTIRVRMWNSSNGLIVQMVTAGSYTSSDGEIHIFIHRTGTTGGILINGADDTAASPTLVAGDVDLNGGTIWAVGANFSGGLRKLAGCLGDLWFDSGTSLGASDVTKFYDGKPVGLGADGSTPTGSAPVLYLGNPAATFHQDLSGNDNDFTVTGALEAC